MDKLYTDEDVKRAWSTGVLMEHEARIVLDAVLPAYLNRLADEVEQAHRDTPDCGYARVVRLLRRKADETQ